MSMNQPSLDDLSENVPSKFTLVTLSMKRARQIKAGSRPLIETISQKPVTIAMQEILEGVVRFVPLRPADELEAEEQAAMLAAIGLSEPTSVAVTRRMEELFGPEGEEEGHGYEEEEDLFEEEEEDLFEEEEEEEEGLKLGDDEESEDEEEPEHGSDFIHDEEPAELDTDLELDEEAEEESDEAEDAEEETVVAAEDEEAAPVKKGRATARKAEPATAPRGKAAKAQPEPEAEEAVEEAPKKKASKAKK